MERLSRSPNLRDQILAKILDDELNKRDWVITNNFSPNRIIMYSFEDKEEETQFKNIFSKPNARRDADLEKITKKVKKMLFEGVFDDINDIDVDLRIILETTIYIIEEGTKYGCKRT